MLNYSGLRLRSLEKKIGIIVLNHGELSCDLIYMLICHSELRTLNKNSSDANPGRFILDSGSEHFFIPDST
jgi:hypothetical protein